MVVPISLPPWHQRRLLWVWGQDCDSCESRKVIGKFSSPSGLCWTWLLKLSASRLQHTWLRSLLNCIAQTNFRCTWVMGIWLQLPTLYGWEKSSKSSFWCWTRFDQGRRQYFCDHDLSGGHRQEHDALTSGSANDGAHSQNEKLNGHNYIEGTKMLAAYLYEVCQLKVWDLFFMEFHVWPERNPPLSLSLLFPSLTDPRK